MPRILLTAISSMSAATVITALRGLPISHLVGCDIYPAQWLETAQRVDNFYRVPHARLPQDYLSALQDLCHKENITHILPLTDLEVDLLTEPCSGLEPARICIAPYSVVQVVRDKYAWTQRLAQQSKLRTVPSILLKADMQAPWPFPLAAKPRRGRSRQGFFCLENQADLQWLAKRTAADTYVVQPYLSGNVVVVDIVRDSINHHYAAVCREELLRTSNGAGLVVRLLPDARLEATTAEIAALLGWHGCANLEFICHEGDYLLMDINPRCSAGIGFSQLAGYNMVANHMKLFLGTHIETRRPYETAILSRDTGSFKKLIST